MADIDAKEIKDIDEQTVGWVDVNELTPEEDEAIVAMHGEPMSKQEAKEKASSNVDARLRDMLISPETLVRDPQERIAKSQQYLERVRNAQENPEFNLVEQEMLNVSDASNREANYAANSIQANEMVQKAMKEVGVDDTGLLGWAADFIDYNVLRGFVTGFEDLTSRTERRGKELLSDMVFLSPKEFKVKFQEFLDDARSEGVLTSDNLFAILQTMEEVQSKGYDPADSGKIALTALGVPSTVAGVAKAGKAATAISKIASISGSRKAAQAATNVSSTTPHAPTMSTAGVKAMDMHQAPTRPSAAWFASKLAENKIVKEIIYIWRSGAFGRAVKEEDVLRLGYKVARDYASRVNNMMHDFNVADEGLGLYTVNMKFGRVKDGHPYKLMSDGSVPPAVNDLAKKTGGQVVHFDPDDKTKGVLIELTERIDKRDLVGALDPEMHAVTGVVRNAIGRTIGSSDLRDVEHLSSLAQMSEGARAAAKEVLKPYIKAIRRVDSKGQHALNAVYRELRDGQLAHMRGRLSDADYKIEFAKHHPDGASPTQKDMDAYRALADIEEADYLLKAVNVTNRYVDKGYKNSIKVGDEYVPAKQVRASDVDGDIYDIMSRGMINKSSLPDDTTIWKVERPVEGKYTYVARATETRVIEPSDVMGYNVGGSRFNPDARYFIVNGDEGGRLTTMFTAFSYKQAQKAVKEIQTIQEAIKSGASNIDDVIKMNNGWNPSIETMGDLQKFATDNDWNLTAKVGFKSRSDKILSNDVLNPDVATDMRWDDFVRNDLSRRDKVLLEYGGTRQHNDDPVNVILNQYRSSAFAYSNREYAVAAMTSWVKNVEANEATRGWISNTLPAGATEAKFLTANISKDTREGKRMSELRDIIMRRINIQDDSATAMRRFGEEVSEYIFDKTGKKVRIGDPTDTMLKIGFQSAFGFMNVSQFFMQAFHTVAITAISPVAGGKASIMAIPLRMALHATEPEAHKLAVSRLAKASNMSLDEAEELVEYIRTSGRSVVDGDAVEAGTGIGYGLSGWMGDNTHYSHLKATANTFKRGAGTALEAGLLPFRQGERLARLTGITTAFLEFKKANPKVSSLSDAGRLWITNREQALTFNMTGTSRGTAQSGLMKIPTQWLTYVMRSIEAMAVGRDFTAAERARLGVVLTAMFGGSGFGWANAGDYVAEALDVEFGSPEHTTLRYGVLDGLSQYLLGDGDAVSLGKRLSPLQGVTDLYKKVTEEGAVEAIGGPSSEIIGGIGKAFYSAAGNLLNGRDVLLSEDLMRIIRQPSGIDNIAKAIGVIKYHEYRSKNGIRMGHEMGLTEALTLAFGFTPLQITELYDRMADRMYNTKEFGSFKREVSNKLDRAIDLMSNENEQDFQRGLEMMDDISKLVEVSPFSNKQKAQLRSQFGQSIEERLFKLQKWMFENDKQNIAISLERYQQ